ncbi:GntR family transcriptional regulator [Actinopolymorpha sp. B17G11]|uniref:GntR family transcriptional regulator n=1 Tax=Actinopolymorpha sp. B17G11 TaxID=3160861 RepID=UPI0032E49B0C
MSRSRSEAWMSLRELVVGELERRIVDGTYPLDAKLPTEPELAEEFSTSRTTIRAAVGNLEARGLVSREQGRGTFVRSTGQVSINMLLEANLSVTTVIRSAGMEPGTTDLAAATIPAPPAVASALRIAPRTPVIVIHRTRTANDLPVAHSADYLVKAAGLTDEPSQYQTSVYDLLERVHREPVASGLARIEPAQADNHLAGKLEVKEGALLLVLSQVHELSGGAPVMYSVVSLRSDALHLYVHRGPALTELRDLPATPFEPA